MSDWVVRINGVKDRELGLAVTAIGQPWSPGQRARGATQIPGTMGQLPSSVAREAPRITPVTFMARPGSGGDTVSGRQALIDSVMAWTEGLLEVEYIDQPGRVRLCRVDESEFRAAFENVSFVESAGALAMTVRLLEDAAVSWLREPEVLAVGSTPAPVPLGTAPSVPVFRFAGPFTGVTLIYRAASGRVLSTLVVGGEVGAEDYLEIDTGTFGSSAIVLSESGVRTDRTDLYASGDLGLLFDPTDGDKTREFWPTVEANRPGVVEYIKGYR